MRPEDFKLNSDYLSLSTATNYSSAVTFGTVTVGAGATYSQSVDFTVPQATKVICDYYLSLDGINWFKTNEYVDNSGFTFAIVSFQRTSRNVLHVSLFVGNPMNSSQTWGGVTLYFKESTINAPDMN